KLCMNAEFFHSHLADPAASALKLLKIVKFPDPVLGRPAMARTEYGEPLAQLVQNMLFTMYRSRGIGLAAPQIGLSERIFVLDVDYVREKKYGADGNFTWEYTQLNPHVFINPTIEERSGEIDYEEGCLSLPGIYETVSRAQNIGVKFFDVNGA